MDQPADWGDVRRRIAIRAMALTGVSDDEILRQLGTIHVRQADESGDVNWSIDILAPSTKLRKALEQAIRETAATIRIVRTSDQPG